jgi:hypothetical protein
MKRGPKGEKPTLLWDDAPANAFKSLKAAFLKPPLLAHFDHALQTRIETDASVFALGAILSQKGADSHWHPVAFHSRKFKGTELNYSTHDQELLAIVEACKIWRHFLHGSKQQVEVLTDHRNLIWFKPLRPVLGRHAR